MSNRLRNFISTTFLILKNLRIWSQYKFLLWKKQLTSSFEGEMDTPWTDKVTSQFYFILFHSEGGCLYPHFFQTTITSKGSGDPKLLDLNFLNHKEEISLKQHNIHFNLTRYQKMTQFHIQDLN